MRRIIVPGAELTFRDSDTVHAVAGDVFVEVLAKDIPPGARILVREYQINYKRAELEDVLRRAIPDYDHACTELFDRTPSGNVPRFRRVLVQSIGSDATLDDKISRGEPFSNSELNQLRDNLRYAVPSLQAADTTIERWLQGETQLPSMAYAQDIQPILQRFDPAYAQSIVSGSHRSLHILHSVFEGGLTRVLQRETGGPPPGVSNGSVHSRIHTALHADVLVEDALHKRYADGFGVPVLDVAPVASGKKTKAIEPNKSYTIVDAVNMVVFGGHLAQVLVHSALDSVALTSDYRAALEELTPDYTTPEISDIKSRLDALMQDPLFEDALALIQKFPRLHTAVFYEGPTIITAMGEKALRRQSREIDLASYDLTFDLYLEFSRSAAYLMQSGYFDRVVNETVLGLDTPVLQKIAQYCADTSRLLTQDNIAAFCYGTDGTVKDAWLKRRNGSHFYATNADIVPQFEEMHAHGTIRTLRELMNKLDKIGIRTWTTPAANGYMMAMGLQELVGLVEYATIPMQGLDIARGIRLDLDALKTYHDKKGFEPVFNLKAKP